MQVKRPARIAVLGAGIMGSSAALVLARRGAAVTLFDAAPQPFTGASRWNEGKIHLGYLYNADPGLGTARHILPGSLSFKPLVERMIGRSLAEATTQGDDIFLCHRQSVVTPDAMQHYFRQVTELVRGHPAARDYLVDARSNRFERLPPAQLAGLTGSDDIVAAFRIPERSVSTLWLADRYLEALAAEPGIEARCGQRVEAVRRPADGSDSGPWHIVTGDGQHGPYDVVVNALWESRAAVDRTLGLPLPTQASNRYRLALFIRTGRPLGHPCALVATGPFGDVKNYNGRDFYLSWYPAGLRIDSQTALPPPAPVLDPGTVQAVSRETVQRLCELLPGVADIADAAESALLRGGWVFAAAQGVLSDPKASLHQRAGFGVQRLGSYFSVDTGKYSAAPWLAEYLADAILPGLA